MKLVCIIILVLFLNVNSRDFDHNSSFHGYVDIDSIPKATNPECFIVNDRDDLKKLKKVNSDSIPSLGCKKINDVYQVSSIAELHNVEDSLNGNNGSFIVDGTLLINSPHTTPPNMACVGWTGKGFVTGTSTLTIQNWACDPAHQIFDTTVTVILPGIYKVEYYGGRSDSSTVNTSAINATLNSIKAAGRGTWLLKNGVYITNGGHLLQGIHNLTMQGSGDSRIFLSDNSNQSMFYTNYDGLDNFSCEGIKFNGNYINQDTVRIGRPWYQYVCGALVLSSITNGKIIDCEFWNCAYGVNLGTNGTGRSVSVIERNYFNTCGVGVDTYGHHFHVNHNIFENMIPTPKHKEGGIAIVMEPVNNNYTVKAHQSNDTVSIDSMGALIKLSRFFNGLTMTWTTATATSPAYDSLVGFIVRFIDDSTLIARDTCTRSLQLMVIQQTIDETISEDSLWYYNENFSLENSITGNTIRECYGGISVSGSGSSGTNVNLNNIANCSQFGISAYQPNHRDLNISFNTVRNVRDTNYLPQTPYGHGIVLAGARNLSVTYNIVSYCNNGIFHTGQWSYGRKDRLSIQGNICSFNAKNGIYVYNTDGGKISNNYLFDNNRSKTGLTAGVYLNSTTYRTEVSNNFTYESDTTGVDYGVYIENGDNSRQLMIGRNPTVGTSSGELWGNLSNVAAENYINKKIISDGSTGLYGVAGLTLIPKDGKSDAALISFLPFSRAAGESRAYAREFRNSYLPQGGSHILNGGQHIINGVMISSRPSTPSLVCTTSVGSDTLKSPFLTNLLPGDRVLLKGARDSSGTPVDLNTTIRYVSNDFKTIVINDTCGVAGNSITGIFHALIGDIILLQTSSGGFRYCRTASTTSANAVWDNIYPIRGSPAAGNVITYNGSGYFEVADTLNITKLTADTVQAGMNKQAGTWHSNGYTYNRSETISIPLANTWYQVKGSTPLFVAHETTGFTFSADTTIVVNASDNDADVSVSYSAITGKDYRFMVYNVTSNDTAVIVPGNSTTGAGNKQNTFLPGYIEANAGDRVVLMVMCTTVTPADITIHGVSFRYGYIHDM